MDQVYRCGVRTLSVGQPDILTLAKQGDPRAITLLLNQVLRTKNVATRVSRQEHCLKIVLEAPELPPQAACVQLIEKGMRRLNSTTIQLIIICGRKKGQEVFAWRQVLDLTQEEGRGKRPDRDQNLSVDQTAKPFKVKSSHSPHVSHPQASPKIAPIQENCDLNPQSSASPAAIKFKGSPSKNRKPQGKTAAVRKVAKKTSNKHHKSGLLIAALGLVLLPLSGWAINARQNQLTAFLSGIPQTLVQMSQGFSQLELSLPSAVNLPESSATPESLKASVSPTPLEPISPTIAAAKTAASPRKPGQKGTVNQPSSFIRVPSPSGSQPGENAQTSLDLTQLSSVALSSLKTSVDPATLVSIKAVGDIVLGTDFPYNKLPANEKVLLQSVKPLLQGADLLFGNFESTLTDYPYSAKDISQGMVFAFRTPPNYNKLLKEAGFQVLSLANNHSFDFGQQGFKDTFNHINRVGIKAVGEKNQIVYETVKGVSVAFIGFSYFTDGHNSMHNLAAGKALVKTAQENADIVIISVHAGAEGSDATHVYNQEELFYGENRGNMVQFSHTMIDAGADLVLGHGPHVPRAMELYQGKLIAYSLGNFVGYRTLSTAGNLGHSLVLEVKLNPQGDFVMGNILPIQLDQSGIPDSDSEGSSIQLIQSLTKSDFPKTLLTISNDGKISVKPKTQN